MAEVYGPREDEGPPKRLAQGTPGEFEAQRPLEQFIATTLHEIQDSQGRSSEKTEALTKAIDKLSDKIDRLNDASVLSGATLGRIEPKVNEHHDALKTIRGILIGVTAVVAVAGAAVYFTNKSRLDRVLLILDSPSIQKILKKEGG